MATITLEPMSAPNRSFTENDPISPISPLPRLADARTTLLPADAESSEKLASIALAPASPATDSNDATSPLVTGTFESPEEREAAFQSALDDIVRQADSRMKMLDSIHEAMQKELHDMFDRHEHAKSTARRFRDMTKSLQRDTEVNGEGLKHQGGERNPEA